MNCNFLLSPAVAEKRLGKLGQNQAASATGARPIQTWWLLASSSPAAEKSAAPEVILRPLRSIGQASTMQVSPAPGRRISSPVMVPSRPPPPPDTTQETEPGQSSAAQITSAGTRPSPSANTGLGVQGPATTPAAAPANWPVKTRRPTPSSTWSPQQKHIGWNGRWRPGKPGLAAIAAARLGGGGGSGIVAASAGRALPIRSP